MSAWNVLREFIEDDSNRAAQDAVSKKQVHALVDQMSIISASSGNKKLADFLKSVVQKIKQLEASPADAKAAVKKVVPDMPAVGSAFATP